MALNGYTVPCGRKTGGLKRIGLFSAKDLISVTEANGKISAISITAGTLNPYQFQQDQAEITIGGSETSVDITLEFWLEKMSAEGSVAINEILDELPCGLCAIAELANGEACLLGYSHILGKERPFKKGTPGGGTGREFSADSYQSISLTVTQPDMPLFFDKSVDIDALYAA